MTDEKVVYKNQGIGFGGLLTILFIGLKLGHVIDWSWWWILSPIWISFAIAAILLTVAVFIAIKFGS